MPTWPYSGGFSELRPPKNNFNCEINVDNNYYALAPNTLDTAMGVIDIIIYRTSRLYE